MPIRLGNTYTTKETPNNRHNVMIFPFGKVILFRSARASELLKNTSLIKMRTKGIRGELPIVIRPNITSDGAELGFNHLKELNEYGKHIKFMFNEIKSSTSNVIV